MTENKNGAKGVLAADCRFTPGKAGRQALRALLWGVFGFGLSMAVIIGQSAQAATPPALAGFAQEAARLVSHKALYDIRLVATHNGAQVVNISGKMYYDWKPTCEGWISGHRFDLNYEYTDAPPMRITSDFSTFEPFDGRAFDFTSRRRRDGEMYQEIRGSASLESGDSPSGKAVYVKPGDLKFDLPAGTVFPMGHTVELLRRIARGEKFFTATLFDGSDEEGPVEVNAFLGAPFKNTEKVPGGKGIDASLLAGKAWNVRMAFFPLNTSEAAADYEMDMVFYDNGVISDMTIAYKDFTISQTLVALEKIPVETCHAEGKGAR